jgi:hypothetical protein
MKASNEARYAQKASWFGVRAQAIHSGVFETNVHDPDSCSSSAFSRCPQVCFHAITQKPETFSLRTTRSAQKEKVPSKDGLPISWPLFKGDNSM